MLFAMDEFFLLLLDQCCFLHPEIAEAGVTGEVKPREKDKL